MIELHSKIFIRAGWLLLGGTCVTLTACDNHPSPSGTSTAACDGLVGTSGFSRKVMDGDTFRLQLSNGETEVIRLDQIDAPEKMQPWSNKSRQSLKELLGQGEVCVVGTKHDKYGRLIGDVHANGVDVNYEMVRQGAAWAYRQYLRDTNLLKIESDARASKRGLWSMPSEQTIPPWEFRHPKFSGANQNLTIRGQTGQSLIGHMPSECAAKPTCRQMSSCDEAKMWEQKCGGQGIDGDGDGIPCERLCIPRS